MTSISQSYQWGKTKTNQKTLSLLLQILGGSALIALCSQIKIDLPFTFVPITMQTFAVLMIGARLGSWKGLLAVLAYFSEIAIGLPVLAGGVSDPLVFIGPKGGYVLGFALQAFIMGWVIEKKYASLAISSFIGAFLATTVEMALGISVLSLFVGWSNVLWIGLIPFVPGELIKIFFVTLFIRKSRKI